MKNKTQIYDLCDVEKVTKAAETSFPVSNSLSTLIIKAY